jgi:hypothetical protein
MNKTAKLAKQLANDCIDIDEEKYLISSLFADLRRAIKKANYKLTFLEKETMVDITHSIQLRNKISNKEN